MDVSVNVYIPAALSLKFNLGFMDCHYPKLVSIVELDAQSLDRCLVCVALASSFIQLSLFSCHFLTDGEKLLLIVHMLHKGA